MNRARMVIVLVMLIVLAVTLAGAFMTRGVMAYLPFLQAQEGELDGSLRTARSCGSTALADSGNSGGLGTVGGGERTRPRGRAPCGSRSRPGVLAVTEAGKP